MKKLNKNQLGLIILTLILGIVYMMAGTNKSLIPMPSAKYTRAVETVESKSTESNDSAAESQSLPEQSNQQTADKITPKSVSLKINQWKTKNNVDVYFVAAPELPMLDIMVTFKAGAAMSATKPGVAALTNAMLNEGTKKYDNEQISEKLESLGAIFGSSIDKDKSSINLRSLTDQSKLAPALEIFNDLLANATFPQKNFNRVKNQAIENLTLSQQYPEVISSNQFYKLIYANHPYGVPTAGTIESVKTIKRDDLISFYKKFYNYNNAQITLVGDLSEDKAKELSEDIAAHMLNGEKAADVPEIKLVANNNIFNKTNNLVKHINFPSTQTHIIFGSVGIKRSDPDYFALTLGNHILGDMPLTSLLFKNVRIDQGLAYSVSSDFIAMKNQGPFLINMQTRNEKANQALDVSKQTLTDFLKNGPTEQELTLAKQNLTGQFPINIASNSKKLATVAAIGFYNLPLDYLDTYVDNINKISQQDIMTAFNKHVKIDNLTIVTVGNAEVTRAAKLDDKTKPITGVDGAESPTGITEQ